MVMRRKSLGILVLAVSVVTVTMGATTSWAGPPPATGTVGCKVIGAGVFHPMLTLAGSAGGVKYSYTAKSNDCSANAHVGAATVNITGVTIQANGYWNPTVGPSGSKCATLPTDKVGALSMTFTWTSVPAIAPTVLTTKLGEPWRPTGAILDYKFPRIGGFVAPGSVGSFTPPGAGGFTYTFTTNIVNPCGAGWGPYPNFTITGGFFNLN
jgi:hypothetical protein